MGRFLKERGYRYIHIGNWFAPTRTVRLADESLAMPWGSDFEAKLEETTFKPTLDDLMSVTEPPAHHILHRRTAIWQFHEFERVRTEPGPKLVILHVLLPHDPYVFDEIGEYPDEQARETRSEGDKYTRQTTYLNDQVRRIVDELLDVPPDEQPIVVIAGDEGPYPTRYAAAKETFDWGTATTTELETKYGILDAFYLPGDAPPGAPAPYPTMSSWNTFRVVLLALFRCRPAAAARPIVHLRGLEATVRPDRRHGPPAAAVRPEPGLTRHSRNDPEMAVRRLRGSNAASAVRRSAPA